MIPKSPTRIRLIALGVLLVVLAAACGSGSTVGDLAGDSVPVDREVDDPSLDDAKIVFEPAGEPGQDPFTPSVSGVLPTHLSAAGREEDSTADADGTAEPEADATAPGLYGGSGDNAVCDVDQLIDFLLSEPDKAAAWAGVQEIEVDEIEEYIHSLTPAVLEADTRVTNHGYRDGQARPLQSTLAAGTAVLVDGDGVPRARCACGNPLEEPIHVPGEDPEPVESPVGTMPAAPEGRVNPFCVKWAEVADGVVGGPASFTELSVADYVDVMAQSFTELVEAAAVTQDFPADAFADLIQYRDYLIAASGYDGTPPDVAGADDLRDRLEEFIVTYCSAQQAGEAADPASGSDDGDPADGTAPAAGNCGSMQFLLLTLAADELGLDHAAVSGEYNAAMEAVLAGVDPGPEFDLGDLSPMLAFEEIGCLGATAMQQLFADNGMADVIEGTELGA